MIYGVTLPEKHELIIAGADTITEQRSFLTGVADLIQDTDITRYLTDPTLTGFQKAPSILEFADAEAMETFVDANAITVVSLSQGVFHQSEMLARLEFDLNDKRTIAEIYDIPAEALDKRTPEQKERDKDKEMRKRQEAGDITGSSFDEADTSGGLTVYSWGKPVVHEDGTVEFGDILADKNLFGRQTFHLVLSEDDPQAYERIFKQAGLTNDADHGAEWANHPEQGILIKITESGHLNLIAALEGVDHTLVHIENPEMITADDNWKIADDYLVLTYYRVDLKEEKLDGPLAVLAAVKQRPPYVAREVAGFGCWLAYVREYDASRALTELQANGFAGEIVAVDPLGERILEEGTEGAVVLDAARHEIEPPLPWNDGAAEFAALSPEEQKKNLLGKYFLFTLREYDRPLGRVIHIAPRSYFHHHERIWEGSLDLSHLLGVNIEKFGDAPGVYHCTSLPASVVTAMLDGIGMSESLMLRMYANTLPNFDQRIRDQRRARAQEESQ